MISRLFSDALRMGEGGKENLFSHYVGYDQYLEPASHPQYGVYPYGKSLGSYYLSLSLSVPSRPLLMPKVGFFLCLARIDQLGKRFSRRKVKLPVSQAGWLAGEAMSCQHAK